MTDDELDAALAALPTYSPTPDFADRVMAQVAVGRPSLAGAAALVLVVAGSILASSIWTLRYQASLASFARQASAQASAWIWHGLQTLAQSALGQEIAAHPIYMASVVAFGSLMYAGGLFALFRLMTGSTSSRVAYARH